jgi:hypothetical protein
MRRFAFVAALLLACAGCKGGTPIKDILDDPSRFSGKTVQIAGTVTKSVGVLGMGAYELKDETGTITVVSKTNGAPREGAKVGVEGTVQQGFTLGTTSVTAVMETKRKEP